MTPAEKAAATKKPRKTKPFGRRSPRQYPWNCIVRDLRTAMRLSMRDVADGVGMSVAGLWEIERGSDPLLLTARNLANFFGKTVEELWPGVRVKK